MPIQGLVTGGWLAVFAAGSDGSLGYMGKTPGNGVVDLDSRLHGTANLYRLVEHLSAGVP